MAPPAKKKGVVIEEYLAWLRENLWMPYDLLTTPARDLTREEALTVVLYLLAWGKLNIANRESVMKVDGRGNAEWLSNSVRPTISPSTIDGVNFRYLSSIDRKGNKQTVNQTMGNLDPRNIVFLYKLAQMLRLRFQVHTIYHIGFMFAASRVDCHGQGRAMDFGGAAGPNFDLTVAGNWTAQPVTLLKDYRDAKSGKQYKAGQELPDWPNGGFRDVYFRLDPSQNPNVRPDYFLGRSATLARDLFRAVYDLAAQECTDTDGNAGATTTIGPSSSNILHPDYPRSAPGTPHGREAHWQHMHMQIGPVGTETNPP